jgi:nitrite reductase/ring-hydroxylating ferredoxin subunit
MRSAPKDGRTRLENRRTQPLRTPRVFANRRVVAEGWYPALASARLQAGRATSVLLTWQRVALWRDDAGAVHAVDAFCPHMGADLGNGAVRGGAIECYFHRWRFDERGELAGCHNRSDRPEGVRVRSWPVEEAYGFIWVYAGDRAPYPVPRPPGADGPLVAWHLGRRTLFAHHHVMMVGGIDLQHFSTVHGLDVRFDVAVDEGQGLLADWRLDGDVPVSGWRSRIAGWLLGGRISYDARFAGGSVVTLAYGPRARLGGEGPALPALYILWGGVAQQSGVSDVEIFLLAPRTPGVWGGAVARARLALTAALLAVLRDDDVKAFPYMRFQPGRLVAEDGAVTRLIRFFDRLPVSPWSPPRARVRGRAP